MSFPRGVSPRRVLASLGLGLGLLLAGCDDHAAFGRPAGEEGDASATASSPADLPAPEEAADEGETGGIDLRAADEAAGARARSGGAADGAGGAASGSAGEAPGGAPATGAGSGATGSTAASSGGARDGSGTAGTNEGAAGSGGAAGGADSADADVAPLPEEARWGTVRYRTVPARTETVDGNGGSDDGGGASAVAAESTDVRAEAGTDTAGGSEVAGAAHVGPEAARFPRPEKVRGLYVNAWAAGSRARMSELLDITGSTEVNALVIDIKDATGYVSHRTEVPLAHEIGATGEVRIRDIEGLLEQLDSAGVYPIARIVIVKDPILAEYRPELAVQDTAGGIWIDEKDTKWLNPYDTAVWDYHLDLAREVAELGFPEIQWDYVRFPDAPRSQLDRAVFDGADGRTKAQGVRAFLAYARERLADLDVVVTADVFGVTTSAARDVGIGQLWESFIDVVDVALPMVYPSHYWPGSFGHDVPNAYPYEIVRHALTDALRRSDGVEGAGATRPWLQDFSLGEPRYTAPEVRAQIQATYDAGIDEWILWNPGSRYTVNALEPEEGFRYEPWVRVGGIIVPVSRRFEAIDAWREAEAARKAAEREARRDSIQAAARDSARAQAARDSAAARASRDSAARAPRDSLSGRARLDSLRRVEPNDTVLIGGR